MKSVTLAAHWLRSRLQPSTLILGYHRVADVPTDPYAMVVSPAHFAAHLEVIQRCAKPLRLPELLQHMAAGTLPPRSVTLSFDDGYADFHSTIEPLLRRYEIPATLFVVSGNLGRPFWWDQLQALAERDEGWPDALGQYADAASQVSREAQLGALYQRLLAMPTAERSALLDNMAVDCDARAITADELRDLGRSDWVEIGAHTVTHPRLADLPEDQQQHEITQSKRDLEALLGRPVAGFSFPNGSVSSAATGWTQAAGYRYACTSRNQPVYRATDPFGLPRFWVGDCSGAQFEGWLRRWL